MGLSEVYKKQGGSQLLRQYLKHGLFFTALGQFILLGRSRTALEILRLSTQLKAKQKLEKKYRSELIRFANNYDESLPHENSDKVWVCWFQGMENAPTIVQRCFESLKENMPERDIMLLTANNMDEYAEFPDYIIDKWDDGQISNAHMADLLRLELLIRYGGMWVDATVFCSGSDIPDYFFNSDLFMFQCLKPGRDGHSHLVSNWLMSAKTNNKVLMAVQYLCYDYWKNNNSAIDYFFFHDFISIALEYFEEEWKAIIPRDNATPHELQFHLFDTYDEGLWDAIKSQTPFHKLTYKYSDEQVALEKTFFKKVLDL